MFLVNLMDVVRYLIGKCFEHMRIDASTTEDFSNVFCERDECDKILEN